MDDDRPTFERSDQDQATGKGGILEVTQKGIERPLKAVGIDFGFHTAVNTLKLTGQGIAPGWAGI